MYYCEYLPRLNTVSIALEFPADSISDIQKIQCEGQSLGIVSKSNQSSLCLPPGFDLSSAKIGKLLLEDGYLRLNLSSPPVELPSNTFLDSHVSRWSCNDLQAKTPIVKGANAFTFKCKQCESIIIDSATKSFKDLPSEYWYELMDFWHCHKPNSDDHCKSGYGELTPHSEDIVYIGSYYILLTSLETVCDINAVALCAKCQAVLGEYTNQSLKLHKWSLVLAYKDTKEGYLKAIYFYLTILDKINSLALRKFLVRVPPTNQTLYFWAINVGFNVSIDGKCLEDCMKIAYYLSESEDDAQYEPLEFYGEMAIDFLHILTNVNSALPPSLRSLTAGNKKYSLSLLSQEPF